MVQLDRQGMQCQLIILIVFIVFVLIDIINYVNCIDRINRINPGVLNCIVLKLKDNTKDPKESGMTFWG